eukprot:CCRYP_004097-RA/>CCRYP_004097-RA protein AED:0.56 eAED:0.30 QI:0/-1/0/1/-1/1/1/0/629
MGESTDTARLARLPRQTPTPAKDKPSIPYPPSDRQLPFSLIKDLTRDSTTCPGCFATNRQGERCREGFCYPLLTAGFLLQHKPEEANTKLQELKDKAQQRKGGKSRGRARRANDNDEEDHAPPAPTLPPNKPPPPDVLGSGKRATSSDPPPPPSLASATQQHSPQPHHNHYADLESDSDDDAGCFVPLEDSHNPKTHSTSYPIASARRTTVSDTFLTIARKQLRTIKLAIKHEDEAICCADSGATRHMFPDYNTFISYHKCKNKTVKLGDSTELPIMGYGSAKFTLNGHVILVRHALHVPGLTNPLYSLRQHRFMAGCGFFSHYDSGAFLLFPNFTIKVDDRIDWLLNFKPIGQAPSPPLEYAEPRTSDPAFDIARPAHLIEPDIDDDPDVSTISYAIPTPKTHTSSVPDTRDTQTPWPTPRSPSPTSVIELDELERTATTPLSKRLLHSLHNNPNKLPPVPPSYTPGACETCTKFDALKLHKIFGCRRFRSQTHLIAASKNASLLAGGKLPPTTGDFASITMPNRGKHITKRRRFLDKVHLDIVFGDCVALGGFRYALLLVDVATRFTWIYGMHTVSSGDIILALETFHADTGTHPKTFHADFDQKLIGGAALRHINQHSRIIAAPAR